jgi:hypothetical protein
MGVGIVVALTGAIVVFIATVISVVLALAQTFNLDSSIVYVALGVFLISVMIVGGIILDKMGI